MSMQLTKVHLVGCFGHVEKEKTILKITFWTVPSMYDTVQHVFYYCYHIPYMVSYLEPFPQG